MDYHREAPYWFIRMYFLFIVFISIIGLVTGSLSIVTHHFCETKISLSAEITGIITMLLSVVMFIWSCIALSTQMGILIKQT